MGRIASTPMTFGSLLTQDGQMKFYLGQGQFTEDLIPKEFFGCAGVAQIDSLQDVLQTIVPVSEGHQPLLLPEAASWYS